MQIQGSTLKHQPASLAVLFELLRKCSESVTEQSTDGCGGYDPPTSLFNHNDHGCRPLYEGLDQRMTTVFPLSWGEIQATGHETTKGVDQHALVWLDLVEDFGKVGIGFMQEPISGPAFPVELDTVLPSTVVGAARRCGHIGDPRVGGQQ